MTEKDLSETPENLEEQLEQEEGQNEDIPAAEAGEKEEVSEEEAKNIKISELEEQVEALKDKNLRLFAEFENLRKRAARERIETIKTAGQDIIQDLLPVLDDFERAQKSIPESKENAAALEGINLIFNKFKNTLEQKGLKAMDALGDTFDAEKHEAITEVPAKSEDQKGKIVDVVEKGYYLNDKIIRYAKVIVGK